MGLYVCSILNISIYTGLYGNLRRNQHPPPPKNGFSISLQKIAGTAGTWGQAEKTPANQPLAEKSCPQTSGDSWGRHRGHARQPRPTGPGSLPRPAWLGFPAPGPCLPSPHAGRCKHHGTITPPRSVPDTSKARPASRPLPTWWNDPPSAKGMTPGYRLSFAGRVKPSRTADRITHARPSAALQGMA